MPRPVAVSILLLLFLSTFIVFLPSFKASGFLGVANPLPTMRVPADLTPYVNEIISDISMERIKDHVTFFSSLGSRVPGYLGHSSAQEYIYAKFLEYGLKNVSLQPFKIPAPVVKEATLTITSASGAFLSSVEIYPLWPNVVCPPAGTFDGPLIYVGYGNLEDFSGKAVEGSIVLMEFNSWRNWVYAFNFGAKAVIFLEPKGEAVSWQETQTKLSVAAVNLPRFYIKRKDGDVLLQALRQGSVYAHIVSRMIWENADVANIIGLVEGTKKPDEIIVLWAHYDSYSITPSLSPGANEATGIAVLLDLARFFAENPPLRSVMFVALTGHKNYYAGAREFVEEYWFGKPSSVSIGSKIRAVFYLDYYTVDTDNLAIAGRGDIMIPNDYMEALDYVFKTTFWQGVERDAFVTVQHPTSGELVYGADSLTGVLAKALDWPLAVGDWITGWPTSLPRFGRGAARSYLPTIVLDSEVLTIAGGTAVGIIASNSYRAVEWTMSDTIDSINFDNLKKMAEFTYPYLFYFANVETVGFRPFRIERMNSQYLRHFALANVQVVTYDPLKGWYTPVPNALVRIRGIVPTMRGYDPYGVWRGVLDFYQFADENGYVMLKGLIPVYGMAMGVYGGGLMSYDILGYVVDEATGNIIFAPDMSKLGFAAFPEQFYLQSNNQSFAVLTLQGGTIALFDIMDPVTFESIRVDIKILEATSDSPPLYFGYSFDRSLSILAVYTKPEIPVKVIVSTPARTLAIYRNATGSYDLGSGYRVEVGGLVRIPFSAFVAARENWLLDEGRLREAHASYIFSGGGRAENLHSEVGKLLPKIEEALRFMRYDEAYGYAWRAWSLETLAYGETRGLLVDSVQIGSVLLLLLLPFVFMVERLIFGARGWRRLGLLSLMYVAFIALLGATHPGFRLASMIGMVILGTLTIILLFPVLGIIISQTQAEFKMLRRKLAGIHTAEVSTVSTVIAAFSMSGEQLRRRKIRSALTLTTIVIVTFALTTFASSFNYTVVIPRPVKGEAQLPYRGLLIRNIDWSPLQPKQYDFLSSAFAEEAISTPRVWWVPPWIGGGGYIGIQTVAFGQLVQVGIADIIEAAKAQGLRGPNGTLGVLIIWGLTPEEGTGTMNFSRFLVEGRWFEPGDYDALILTKQDAEEIGLKLGDTVEYLGLRMRVIGLLDKESVTKALDIDQESITPLSIPEVVEERLQKKEVVDYRGLHIKMETPGSFIIIPKEAALALGGQVYSMALRFEDPEAAVRAAEQLADALSIDIYVSTGEEFRIYRRGTEFRFQGWQMLIIPLAIGLATVFNTVLGNVYERTTEIRTLSSVGLSPMSVFAVFMSESLFVAVVGSIVGYLVGIGLTQLFIIAGGLGTFLPYPNYSSYNVALTLGMVILSVLIASIYPLYRASKLVTPSLERRWKMPKPKGDELTVPLPFTAEEGEADGLLAYLKEYFETFKEERVGAFVTRRIDYKAGLDKAGNPMATLIAEMAVAPYEQAVTQETSIVMTWSPRLTRYSFLLFIRRLTGPIVVWNASNVRVVEAIRRQFLIWRGLKPEEKNVYIKSAKEKLL